MTFSAEATTPGAGVVQEEMAAKSNPLNLARQTIGAVGKQSRRAILFYSCGKDSIALLDLMAPHFDEIVLVFMYFVPDLAHCNKYLNAAQRKYKNVRLLQLPHFRLTTIYREGIYCQARPGIKLLKLSDIDAQVREQTGIDWTFYGMKKSDSLNRRLQLMTYKPLPIHSGTRKAYPLADLTNREVLAYIRHSKLPPPVVYGSGQSNAVGFNLDCMLWLRQNYPADLEKIYAEFPLSRQVLFDYDHQQHSNQASKI